MVDGLFISSLLFSFFFKLFPEIIEDGRLYKSIPPLYRIDDKKDPFVVDKADYIRRYVKNALKEYKVGYRKQSDVTATYITNDELAEFLSDTSHYVDDILSLQAHYITNDRLLEMIIEEFASINFDEERLEQIPDIIAKDILKAINIQHLMNKVGTEFPEIYYDDNDNLIKGIIDGKYQMIEINETLIKKSKDIIKLIRKWGAKEDECIVLRDNKTGTIHELSLLGILKILKKFQPNIIHRFKGLSENEPEDMKTTIMDPNTRTLIRLQLSDMENDMEIFKMLRGQSPLDAQNRKNFMNSFKIDKDMIDT